MKDNNYSYKKGKTKEEKINNLKKVIILLSQKLEMDLRYIDVELIIDKKDKENIKDLLVLFINILKMKEIKKDHLANIHFNNQINKEQRSCLTEREKDDKVETNLNSISFDSKIQTIKNKENILFQLLNNAKKKNNKNKTNIQKIHKYNLFTLTDSDRKESNDFKIKNSDNNYKYFLSQKDLINEIVNIIKRILPENEFSNFLINDTFNKKIKNIITKIYLFHFELYKNFLITKRFLFDYIVDIKFIITGELFIKDKNIEYNSKIDLEELSKKLKKINLLQMYAILKNVREKKEIKINKLENKYQIQKSYNKIIECYEFYKKIIQVKYKKLLSNLEFQELLDKLKYYQTLQRKDSYVINLRDILLKKTFKRKNYNK